LSQLKTYAADAQSAAAALDSRRFRCSEQIPPLGLNSAALHLRRSPAQVHLRLTKMILDASTMIDALGAARISERGINGVGPFCAPPN